MLPARPSHVSFIMSVERELSRREVMDLIMVGGPGAAPPVIQRLKASHHTAARLVAQGEKYSQVALITGYTAQRISDLATKDPAFQELVAYYADQISEIGIEDAARIQRRLVDVGETALIEAQARLADDDLRAKMPIGEIRQLVALGLDRTVAPPKTAQPSVAVPTKITFNIGARDIRPKEELKDVTPRTKEIEHDSDS